MVEDYRAGLRADRRADEDDRAAGRQITCPMLTLWSSEDDLHDLYGDPREVWRPWCPQVIGHAIKSSHHIAERNPADLVQSLRDFL
jgi:haloacetate dehalogenase